MACEGGGTGSFGSCASQISHLGRACDCTNVQRGHARGSASIARRTRPFLPQARHVAPPLPLRLYLPLRDMPTISISPSRPHAVAVVDETLAHGRAAYIRLDLRRRHGEPRVRCGPEATPNWYTSPVRANQWRALELERSRPDGVPKPTRRHVASCCSRRTSALSGGVTQPPHRGIKHREMAPVV